MATNYVQEGKVIPFTAAGTAIAAGEVVVIGQTLGVALEAIAIGATGQVQIGGVFNVPKADAAVITQGESLTWDSSAGEFDDNAATPASGDVTGPPAVAMESKGATTGETIAVLFTGVPGTVT